jgi:hypothetical protein
MNFTPTFTPSKHYRRIARDTVQKMSGLTLNHGPRRRPPAAGLAREKACRRRRRPALYPGQDPQLGAVCNGGDSEHGNAIPWDIRSDTPHDNP